MPEYYYKARNARGDAVEGRIEAASADAVASQLINSGITPVDIGEARPHADLMVSLRRRLASRRPTLEDMILFSRQMYSLMRAGVPIIRALTGLAENTRNPKFADTLRDVVAGLESGRDLTGAMGRHPDVFNSLVVSMVQVGENTGRLDEAFAQIAQYLDQEKNVRDQVKAAMRYPLMVIVAIVIAVGIINAYVIPQFVSLFKSFHAQLPLPTRILMATSQFTVHYWYAIIVVLIATVAGTLVYVRSERGHYRWDRFKLHLPILGDILLRAMLGRFARAFAMALRAGVPLVQALTVVARAVDNVYVGDRILQMRNGVERGDSLTRTAAATDMFTPLVIQMLAVGEETGAIDELLDEVAGFYEREVDYDLKRLASAIEPVLIVVIGAIVLVLALGVFLPMWDMASAARGTM